MNNCISAAATWLKSKFINAPNDWLEACVEWIGEENQGSTPSQQQVNKLVFEQWLLSDLHELGTQCLPEQINNSDKFQLNGKFALQIDSMVDISQSCYSQLQRVTGTGNTNVDVSADTHRPWEPKAKRMLMLKLTDGMCDVQGMEYEPIRCLNNNLHPGCKILVTGKILCRHGLLMLKEENVSVLGGEVDTLMESNTHKNILQLTLENNISNAGKQYRQEFEGGPTVNTKSDNKPVITRDNKYGTRGAVSISQKKTNSETLKQEEMSVIDEFDEDLPLDVFLDDDMDDFTDAVGLNCSNSTATTLPLQSQNGSCVNTHPPKVTKVSIVNRNNITSLNSNINNQFPHQDKYVQMSSLRQSLPRASVQQEDVTNMNFVEEDFDDDFDMSDFTNSRTKLDTNEKLQVGVTKKRQLISPVDNQNCKRRSYVSNSDVGEYIRPDVSAADQWKGPVLNMKLEGGIVSGRSDVDIDINIEVAPSPENNTNKEGWKCLLQEVNLSYDPWSYLSVVKKYLQTQQLISFKVKAYISTLIGKLECPDSKRWCLPVKINDGTASMDVDLSNKVLTELIGFSAAESQVMRRTAKTDCHVKERLTQGIKSCQQKLIELLCIMEIEISPHVAKPEVTSLTEITIADISVLADRLHNTGGKYN
ncbi:recQ-mediated genome instability protein 1-like [Mytilus galloprovincialis]|uniref:recQ-mediated genome instability protein 1-like n=1 Tax=Mytilus galloprovincialis TaxID=29158 RepID=UPI003F7B70A3